MTSKNLVLKHNNSYNININIHDAPQKNLQKLFKKDTKLIVKK